MILKTFILLATITNPNTDSYVIDYGLSDSDCSEFSLDIADAGDFEIAPGIIVSTENVIFECQEENAIPPCEFEDSDNCFWNAQTRGNGQGESFIAWDGEIFPMNF